MSQVLIKTQSVKPSSADKFWFESMVDWENRPWIQNLELQAQVHHEALHCYLEERISREELVSRKEELPEHLKFICDICQDFQPEWPGFAQQTHFPSWSADMSPPFNPFTTTHTLVMVFENLEKADAWFARTTWAWQQQWFLDLLASTNNTMTVSWHQDNQVLKTITIPL